MKRRERGESMFCLITDGYSYLCIDNKNRIKTGTKQQAKVFTDDKAKNVLKCLPKSFKRYGFHIESINGEDMSHLKSFPKEFESLADKEEAEALRESAEFVKSAEYEFKNDFEITNNCCNEDISYQDVPDIKALLDDILPQISKLPKYVEILDSKQKEYELEILDIRHFLRDSTVPMSTLAMANICEKLQDIERLRKTCKINKLKIQYVLDNINRITSKSLLDEVHAMDKEYRYRRLSKEELENIAGFDTENR